MVLFALSLFAELPHAVNKTADDHDQADKLERVFHKVLL